VDDGEAGGGVAGSGVADDGVVGISGGAGGSGGGEAHSESGGSMGGKGEGGASGDVGGNSRLGNGEKQISLHGVVDGEGSRRSSASFCRFLGFFTGGGAFPGDDTGSAGCGAWTAVESAVGSVTRTGASGAAVAALPRLRRCRWQRRRFPAAAADPAGTGKMHVRDRVWRPAAWLKATRALRPLAKHRSYSSINSAAVTAGCCCGRAIFTTLAPSPLATLAHVVTRGEL
jgi:hypothetical protein